MRELLDRGADLHSLYDCDMKALHNVARGGQVAVANMLLDRCSDLSGVRACSPDGNGAEQRGSGPARGVVSVILKLSWLLLFS